MALLLGVNLPVEALNVPPVPVTLDQVPPVTSPVIKLAKVISALFSQTVVFPSVPAEGHGAEVTFTTIDLVEVHVPLVTVIV